MDGCGISLTLQGIGFALVSYQALVEFLLTVILQCLVSSPVEKVIKSVMTWLDDVTLGCDCGLLSKVELL